MVREQAAKAPIQVKNHIVTLRQMAYVAAELSKMTCGWIPGTALWELKLHMARCQWENACHAEKLRKRLGEFPGGKPNGAIRKEWEQFVGALADAAHGPAFHRGVFGALKPYLLEQYRSLLQETDPIVDAPTVDILQEAVAQEMRQIETANRLYIGWNLTEKERAEAADWEAYVRRLLEELGDLHVAESAPLTALQPYDAYRPSPVGLRDERFVTSFAQEAPYSEAQDEASRYEIHVVMTYLKEMQAVETVATSLYETKGMPWAFYYETSRHCWDEARHCMLGQRRFEQLGFDITKIKAMNGNYAIRQLLDPLYRYAYITMVEEAGSMKRKREWVQMLEKYGRTLTARLVEYDLADERNHVDNGFRWIPEMLKSRGDTRSLDEVVEEAKKLRAQAFELIRIDYDAAV